MKPISFKRILFCTDFSKTADRAFQYALDLAMKNPGSRLILLHIVPEPGAQFWQTYLHEVENVEDKARQDMETKLNETYVSHIPPVVEFEIELRNGKEDEQILDCASEKQANLIVIGREGKSAVKTHLFGAITEHIARKADCPVLIIPGTEH